MNPEIFREYDIRGIAGEDMTKDEVFFIGKGIGTYLLHHNCSKVTVGRDCRTTSDDYARQIIKGLMSTGCHVIDIGVCPTPILYFSIRHLNQEGGVMKSLTVSLLLIALSGCAQSGYHGNGAIPGPPGRGIRGQAGLAESGDPVHT